MCRKKKTDTFLAEIFEDKSEDSGRVCHHFKQSHSSIQPPPAHTNPVIAEKNPDPRLR
jgi:hypothetical protein